ncbi:MAG: trimethylamine methyltransferase family protein, partial [Phycisphaerales bacterium]
EMTREYLNLVPVEWPLYARNPERNVQVGGKIMLVVPGYGSPFISDSDGRRRNANLKDLENFVLMACNSPEIDVTGGLLVEPNDISLNVRPLEVTRILVTNSDKPFMGSVAGKEGAKESIEIARIVFGDIESKPCMIGLININSPLRLGSQMAEALIEYVNASQPVLLTPGILMAMTAPVTVVGAMVQAYAELLGCIVATQVLKPGVPVVAGIGGFGSDLRNCGPGFGRPENALGIQLGAEIARRLKIPFRCSAAVTGSRRPDCRSGYERMMTALTAYNAGAHFCLQAAGILDSIKMMSYEQYVIDLEIWAYIKRFAKSTKVDTESLAVDVIKDNANGLLSHDHTIKHMRDQLYAPALAVPDSYEDWWASNGPDAVARASERVREMLDNIKKPPIDETVSRDLENYVVRRRKVLEGVA